MDGKKRDAQVQLCPSPHCRSCAEHEVHNNPVQQAKCCSTNHCRVHERPDTGCKHKTVKTLRSMRYSDSLESSYA
jgi:hypothetical protein